MTEPEKQDWFKDEYNYLLIFMLCVLVLGVVADIARSCSPYPYWRLHHIEQRLDAVEESTRKD